MVLRLVRGLLWGIFLGGGVGFALVRGLSLATFQGAPLLAYGAAAGVGLLAGLFAGKPFWTRGGQIEAGLKAFFGALLGALSMWALRSWGTFDLSSMGLPALLGGPVGLSPVTSLPVVATVLSLLFELDNTGEPAKVRVVPKGRVSTDLPEADEDAEQEAAQDAGREAAQKKKVP